MRLPAAPAFLLALSLPAILQAHPLPDIPVRSAFEPDGACTIRVEVDLRCFVPDPEEETYWPKSFLEQLYTPAEKDELKANATELMARGVEFFFEPSGAFKPEFTWEFTTLGGGPLVNHEDPVVLTGTWRSKRPDGTTGYSIRANDPNNLAVVFENTLNGKPVERIATLFPKEKSFVLDMTGKNASAATAPPPITASAQSPTVPPQSSGKRSSWWISAALVIAAVAALWFAKLGRA